MCMPRLMKINGSLRALIRENDLDLACLQYFGQDKGII